MTMWYGVSHENGANHCRRTAFNSRDRAATLGDQSRCDRGPRRVPTRQAGPRRRTRRTSRVVERRDPRPDGGVEAPGTCGRGGGGAPQVRALIILDAYPIVAYLVGEPSADEVSDLLSGGDARTTSLNVAEA